MRKGVHPSRQSGVSLIEVLVSVFILLVALLGLSGLLIQSQNSQMESYQRVQALSLAQDMANRINANSSAAYCYQGVLAGAPFTSGFIGTGDGATPATIPVACPAPPVTSPVTPVASAAQQAKALKDLAEWRDLLLGAAEKIGPTGAKVNVGAVLGARGCITLVAGQTAEYQISVAWQGGSETYAPPGGLSCGINQYGVEAQRRAVGLILHATNLS